MIYTTDVILGGMNYTPSEKEAFDEAWKAAVDDGAVDAESRHKYEFVRTG